MGTGCRMSRCNGQESGQARQKSNTWASVEVAERGWFRGPCGTHEKTQSSTGAVLIYESDVRMPRVHQNLKEDTLQFVCCGSCPASGIFTLYEPKSSPHAEHVVYSRSVVARLCNGTCLQASALAHVFRTVWTTAQDTRFCICFSSNIIDAKSRDVALCP